MRINEKLGKPKAARKAKSLEELSQNLLRLFESPDASAISEADYSRIVRFLTDRNMFATLQGISDRLGYNERADLRYAKANILGTRTYILLSQGDLGNLRRMYTQPCVSQSIVSCAEDIGPGIDNYISTRCGRPQDVRMFVQDLQSVFPAEPYYTKVLDETADAIVARMNGTRETLGPADPAQAPVQAEPVIQAVPVPPAASAPAPPAQEHPAAEAEPGERTTFRINRMNVTIHGKPFAYGWRYKVYMASTDADPGEYAFRTLVDSDPYDPQPVNLPDNELASIIAEEYLWYQICDKYPERFVRILESCQFPVKGQLVELASRSFEDTSDMSDREKAVAAVSMLRALQDLHDEGYVHNDVKPGCLLQVDGIWKLSGFDAAFRIGTPTVNMNGIPEYMSPEQNGNGQIDEKSDVWAAAVVLFRALTGRLPFDGRGEMYRTNSEKGLFRPGNMEPGLAAVFAKVFVPDAGSRPSAAALADELEGLLDSL